VGVTRELTVLAEEQLVRSSPTSRQTQLPKYSQSQVCSEFDSKHETRYTGSGR
jgi:hypothetical protein